MGKSRISAGFPWVCWDLGWFQGEISGNFIGWDMDAILNTEVGLNKGEYSNM